MQYAFYNDSIVNLRELNIHVSDLAFHRAYGVFDFFKVKDGHNPWLDWYLDRYYNSLSLALLSIPYGRSDLKTIFNELIEKNGQSNSCIKLLCTGGYSEDGFTPQNKSNFIVLNYPIKTPPPEAYDQGVGLISKEYRRTLPSVKSIDYFYSITLQPQMKQAGAIDVLYHLNGEISETSRSNIFVVKDGLVRTPEKYVLEGITRKRILSVKHPANIKTDRIDHAELFSADEVFITSTTKGVLPIRKIDGQIIGSGSVGPVTRELMNIIQAF